MWIKEEYVKTVFSPILYAIFPKETRLLQSIDLRWMRGRKDINEIRFGVLVEHYNATFTPSPRPRTHIPVINIYIQLITTNDLFYFCTQLDKLTQKFSRSVYKLSFHTHRYFFSLVYCYNVTRLQRNGKCEKMFNAKNSHFDSDLIGEVPNGSKR